MLPGVSVAFWDGCARALPRRPFQVTPLLFSYVRSASAASGSVCGSFILSLNTGLGHTEVGWRTCSCRRVGPVEKTITWRVTLRTRGVE